MQRLIGKNKAQFFSVDFIVGVIVFISILISSIYIWDYSKEKIFLAEKSNNINMVARNAMNSLVETTGNPSNWSFTPEDEFNESNILSLGLLKSSSFNDNNQKKKNRASALSFNNLGILDIDKVQTLADYNSTEYETYKKILGVLGPNYEFELQVKKWNSTDYGVNSSIGIAPGTDVFNIVRIDRFALLEGKYAEVTLKVWENE